MVVTLVLRRDETVRQMAWQMVAQLPAAALLAALTPEAWRSLFDAALVALPQLHSEACVLSHFSCRASIVMCSHQLHVRHRWRRDKTPTCALQQEHPRRTQPVELQQGRRLLQRFLTDGLPPAAQHCGDLPDGASSSLELLVSWNKCPAPSLPGLLRVQPWAVGEIGDEEQICCCGVICDGNPAKNRHQVQRLSTLCVTANRAVYLLRRLTAGGMRLICQRTAVALAARWCAG
jgi:hypothetical protein